MKWMALAMGMALIGMQAQAAVTGTAESVQLHVTRAPVREVIAGLAKLGHHNLVMGEDVRGTVTLHVDQVTAREALEMVATVANLQIIEQKETWLVHGMIRQDDRAETAVSIPLRYAKAEDMQQSLQALLPAERIRINEAANAIVLRGTQREIAMARALISRLDYAYRQVKVEVEVVAVNRDHLKELGIDWDWLSLTGSAEYKQDRYIERIPLRDKNGRIRYDADGNPEMTTRERSDWSIATPKGYGAIQFGRALGGHPYAFFFQAKLNALVADGKAEILAKPNIMTTNGHEARILIGNKIPVLVEKSVNGETTTTTEYREAGIQLLYTPHINERDEITADIHAEVSSPYLVPEMRAYRIVTREADTRVRLRAGDTLTIGGLIDREVMHTKRKIPFLGDIPLLGKLFQSDKRAVSEAEIIILIRAEIVE